jgi:hypothetical protein
MKKLFVLFLCLMAVAGIVFAGTVHPPGEISLDMVLPGYGINYAVVTPDTVLVVETLVVSYSQILTAPDMMLSGLPTVEIISDTGQRLSDVHVPVVDYPLRL